MAISGYADADPLPAAVEIYDGTSWTTNPTSTPYAAINIGQAGTTTAAIIWGGQAPPIWTFKDDTLSWNGSTWTAMNNYSPPYIADMAGFGTQTAAISAGGYVGSPSGTANVGTWNGTSWTEGNNLNQNRRTFTGSGTTTAGMVCGGQFSPSPPTSAFYAGTEVYDGTSWTASSDLANGRYDQGQGPNCPSSDSVIWGGSANGSPYSNIVEEWNDYSGTNPAPGLTMMNEGQIWYNTTGGVLKYTEGAGSWSSGGSLNTARKELENGAFGTQTGALTAGGGDFSVNAETYNGTTWTEVNNLNAARGYIYAFGAAQNAGMMVGGFNPWTANKDLSETWDGTSFTEGNNLNTARAGGAMGGTVSAGFIAGGYISPSSYSNATEEYNGTSWAIGNNMTGATTNGGKYVPGGGGTQTAGLCIGGYPNVDETLEYDGTSWTTSPATLNTAKDYTTSSGSQTNAVNFGDGPASALTEKFNGTTWTEVADLSTARNGCGALDGGDGGAALAIGNSPSSNIVEEWDDPILAIKTVTVS
jgi:hypothetical protein